MDGKLTAPKEAYLRVKPDSPSTRAKTMRFSRMRVTVDTVYIISGKTIMDIKRPPKIDLERWR